MSAKTKPMSMLSKMSRSLSLIYIMSNFLLLGSCTGKESITQIHQTATPPAYTLTPGESLVQLWGGKNHDHGSLEIFVNDTISWEKYIDKDGVTNEREIIRLRILYPELGRYNDQTILVHEGQIIEFAEYRLRVLEIRMRESGKDPIVEVAILGP